jgi:hypothetical protein
MRRVVVFVALTLFALLALLAPDRPGSAEEQNELVVIATASNRGEVDPCG